MYQSLAISLREANIITNGERLPDGIGRGKGGRERGRGRRGKKDGTIGFSPEDIVRVVLDQRNGYL